MNKTDNQLIVDKAKLFEGIREVGNNSSFSDKIFEGLMKKFGWTSGAQWCAYYCRTVYCLALPEYAECFKKVLSGNSQRMFENAKANKCKYLSAITTGMIEPGDIMIFQNKKSSSTGHVGICISVDGDTATLIEGNTNVGGAKFEKEKVDIVIHKGIKIGSTSSVYKSKIIRGYVRFSA